MPSDTPGDDDLVKVEALVNAFTDTRSAPPTPNQPTVERQLL
ncbi:hypothetical protein [Streptomyces alfalfae]|nr:hypothetical protein [Streptomyces alfalfae]